MGSELASSGLALAASAAICGFVFALGLFSGWLIWGRQGDDGADAVFIEGDTQTRRSGVNLAEAGVRLDALTMELAGARAQMKEVAPGDKDSNKDHERQFEEIDRAIRRANKRLERVLSTLDP